MVTVIAGVTRGANVATEDRRQGRTQHPLAQGSFGTLRAAIDSHPVLHREADSPIGAGGGFVGARATQT
ncbi:hypothetical protein [Spirosoma flavus]